MGHPWDRAATEGRWNIGDRLVKVEVSTAAAQEVEEVLAEGFVRIGSHHGVSGE
jgi:hypothetical protein